MNKRQPDHSKKVRAFISIAALLVLVVCGFCIGGFLILRPTAEEPAVRQETVTLEDIGLTLIFPDSWRGKYSIVQNDSSYIVYNTQIREAVSEGIDPFDGGVLFSIVCYEEVLTPGEFIENGYDYTGYRYLFANDDSTYILYEASDVQWDPNDPEQEAVYTQMSSEIQDIEIVIEHPAPN
ncbi:MAG: hypothetical protein NC337_11995 [Roseburia sp.]|nr:hypothetical protein [Roseburia sp.]